MKQSHSPYSTAAKHDFTSSPTESSLDIAVSLRRNSKSCAIPSLLQETRLHPSDFVAPLFVLEGNKIKQPISSMPEVYRYSIDMLLHEVEELLTLGIQAIDLF